MWENIFCKADNIYFPMVVINLTAQNYDVESVSNRLGLRLSRASLIDTLVVVHQLASSNARGRPLDRTVDKYMVLQHHDQLHDLDSFL